MAVETETQLEAWMMENMPEPAIGEKWDITVKDIPNYFDKSSDIENYFWIVYLGNSSGNNKRPYLFVSNTVGINSIFCNTAPFNAIYLTTRTYELRNAQRIVEDVIVDWWVQDYVAYNSQTSITVTTNIDVRDYPITLYKTPKP